MSRVFKGDIGTKIKLNSGQDISSASKIQIRFKKPGGTKGVWAAVLEGTQYGYYILKSGDMDENGVWEVQLYVEIDNWKGYGEIATFTAYETLV